MKRRRFLAAGCAGGMSLLPGISSAQDSWLAPARFTRPELTSDEGGLWALMDREETRLRRSPFSIHDAVLTEYVREIICRLAGDHCPDVRVYLVRNRFFNANMAPNGMMQVWSGLMLRMDNEAQLAAVLGHEIGHYLERHSIDSMRDRKNRTAAMTVFSMFGIVGAIGSFVAAAGAFAYSRDHERQADRIGLTLMSKAGYDPTQAGKVWENLLQEVKAKPGGDPSKSSPMFATHPPADERQSTLAQLAANLPSGITNQNIWEEKTAPYRREWLNEEVKRGQFEESIALLTRLMARTPNQADYPFSRGEVYRMRAKDNDFDMSIGDYKTAIALGDEPPESHRGLGMIYRQRNQVAEAKASFERYLQMAPNASDFSMVKSYVEELGA